MHRWIVSFALLAAMAGTAAANTDTTFATVDEVANDGSADPTLRVRGIPQGQPQAIEVAGFINYSDESGHQRLTSCERMALLAQSRPGRYLLRIVTRTEPFGSGEYLISCRLIQRVP